MPLLDPNKPRLSQNWLPAGVIIAVTVAASLSYALWPAVIAGRATSDAERYASRQGRTIYLHPSGVSFQIAQDWMDWNAEFHNNLHLTPQELQTVRVGAGEWDSEYGEVVNSALPFEECAAHVGGEGWGRQGVSFGDLQVRAYVTNLGSQEIFQRISGSAWTTAKKVSSGVWPGQLQSDGLEDGPWRTAVIRYSVFYGDYGGVANVEFYVRPVSKYQLVLVFMSAGSSEVAKEKRAILDSVVVPGERALR